MRSVAEQAASWVQVLASGTDSEREAFVDWVRAAPEHLHEFLLAMTLHAEMGRLQWDGMEGVKGLLEKADGNVVSFPASGQWEEEPVRAPASIPWKSSGRTLWRGAVAAIIVSVCIAASWWWLGTNSETYATDIGELRSVELTDGTVVDLNSRSKVKVSYTARGRSLQLEGEATFNVARDVARPFRVQSGVVVIQALGTQFNVHSVPSGTTVAVIEGLVQVSSNAASVTIGKGEVARVSAAGKVEKGLATHVAGIANWRDHRLVFKGNTLEDIAAEFNRWNRRQIRIEPGVATGEAYDGAFDADDPQSLISFLARDRRLLLEMRDEEIVIRESSPSAYGEPSQWDSR